MIYTAKGLHYLVGFILQMSGMKIVVTYATYLIHKRSNLSVLLQKTKNSQKEKEKVNVE